VAGGVTKRAKTGETLRYRSDRPYSVRCPGDIFGHATTGCILKAAVMD
jgi:XRE family transcriptional regulator, regulator of sulfur utilization